MAKVLNVYALTFSLVTETPIKGKDSVISYGSHEHIAIAAETGVEAEAYVRQKFSTPMDSVRFHGGPQLVAADVEVAEFLAPDKAPVEEDRGIEGTGRTLSDELEEHAALLRQHGYFVEAPLVYPLLPAEPPTAATSGEGEDANVDQPAPEPPTAA